MTGQACAVGPCTQERCEGSQYCEPHSPQECVYCGHSLRATATNCPKCGQRQKAGVTRQRATIEKVVVRSIVVVMIVGMAIAVIAVGVAALKSQTAKGVAWEQKQTSACAEYRTFKAFREDQLNTNPNLKFSDIDWMQAHLSVLKDECKAS